MNRKSSIIAFAVASLLGVGSVIAEGSMDSATVPEQNEVTSVNVTLQQPLVIDLGQGNLITLPIGTMIGREQTETKVNATGVTIGNETSLRNVTLIQDLTFTDPSTGLPVTLPSGTILRLNVEQRFDATGAVLVKNEFALRAAEPNGTVVRLNNKARTPQSAGGDEDNPLDGESAAQIQ